MKKSIQIILLLSYIISYGQIKTGMIQYKVTLNKEIPILPIPAGINIDLNKAIFDSDRESEKITYTLIFSPEESYFYANPMLVKVSDFSSLAGANNGGKIKYYQNKITKERREFVDTRRLGVQIINRKVLYEWSLKNEIKMIDGYRCYKATSPIIKDDGKKIDNPKSNIIAWYCPEMPIQEGPVGYGGLPGLILELQFYKATFTASKIELNPEKLAEIDRLTFPKAISQEIYHEMIMGTFNNEQLDAIKDSKK